jgi:hypothetical protein
LSLDYRELEQSLEKEVAQNAAYHQ